jgi:hypothetical protein
MLSSGGNIDSLFRFLSFWSLFFNHKVELNLRYLFDDKNSLQVFPYLAKIYIYNIQIIPPPYTLRAPLSESNCLFDEITLQKLGKNNLDRFMPTVA